MVAGGRVTAPGNRVGVGGGGRSAIHAGLALVSRYNNDCSDDSVMPGVADRKSVV